MISFIQSIRASIAHGNALHHWAKFEKLGALVEIQKAVNLESNNNHLPKHLIVKGEFEDIVGRHEESLESFLRAQTMMQKNQTYWNKPENQHYKRRLCEGLPSTLCTFN